MSVVNSDSVRAGASGVAAAYTIDNSCIFNSADSAYLHKTPGGAGNGQVFTISVWIKLGDLTQGGIIGTGNGAVDEDTIVYANITNTIRTLIDTGTSEGDHRTTALYRDPAAWYHFVFRFETTSAVAANRIRMYKNGDLQDMTIGTQISQNFTTAYNSTAIHAIGCRSPGGTPETFFDGYMADVIMIDGQSLAPTSFAETDADSGAYVPIDPSTLTFGTNGFHLDFADSSALGNDVSGNNNDFTVVNLASSDQTTDSPTDSGTTIGNFCVMSPITRFGQSSSTAITVSNGNLVVTSADTNNKSILGSIAIPASGKWYFEMTYDVATDCVVGLRKSATWNTAGMAADSNMRGFRQDGTKVNGSGSAHGSAWSTTNVIQVALDMDNGALYFGINDTYQNSSDPESGASKTGAAFTDLVSTGFVWVPGWDVTGNSVQGSFNFGQLGFAHTPPSGFLALCTANLPSPTINDPTEHFVAKAVTHDGSSTAFTIGWSADTYDTLFMIKNRESTEIWYVVDGLRGYNKYTDVNAAYNEGSVTDANVVSVSGTTITLGSTLSSDDYVVYCWRGGAAGGAANELGSINTVASANTTAGFSIITYTGTGSNATIGHGLGKQPRFWQAKSTVATPSGGTYQGCHMSKGSTHGISWADHGGTYDNATYWQDTDPTSTVISIGTASSMNQSTETFVIYAWAEIDGFSKFGKYYGSGSATEGAAIFCNFSPAYFWAQADASEHAFVTDNARSLYNPRDKAAYQCEDNAEVTDVARDFYSGHVIGKDTDGNFAQNYYFVSFAEEPFTYDGGGQGRAK